MIASFSQFVALKFEVIRKELGGLNQRLSANFKKLPFHFF